MEKVGKYYIHDKKRYELKRADSRCVSCAFGSWNNTSGIYCSSETKEIDCFNITNGPPTYFSEVKDFKSVYKKLKKTRSVLKPE